MEQATRKGKLTRDKFGASMPVDAPYYQSPPFYYRDARSLTVTFETDPDAAAEVLPEGLEVPVPSHAALMVVLLPHIHLRTLQRGDPWHPVSLAG